MLYTHKWNCYQYSYCTLGTWSENCCFTHCVTGLFWKKKKNMGTIHFHLTCHWCHFDSHWLTSCQGFMADSKQKTIRYNNEHPWDTPATVEAKYKFRCLQGSGICSHGGDGKASCAELTKRAQADPAHVIFYSCPGVNWSHHWKVKNRSEPSPEMLTHTALCIFYSTVKIQKPFTPTVH